MQNKRQMVLVGLAAALLLALLVKLMFGAEGALIAQLENGELKQRLEAIHELSLLGSNRALEAIARHGQDEEIEVARQALLALGRRDWPPALDHLTKALGDSRPEVREAAITAIGRHPRDKVDHSLVVDLFKSDPSPVVRAAAANTAGTLYVWDAMPTLVASLRDENGRVRGHSAVAIRRIIGVDHGFKPADPPIKREKVIREIESVWRNYHPYHLQYMKRLAQREAEGG